LRYATPNPVLTPMRVPRRFAVADPDGDDLAFVRRSSSTDLRIEWHVVALRLDACDRGTGPPPDNANSAPVGTSVDKGRLDLET